MRNLTARNLAAICLGAWAWSVCFGMGTQLTSLWLDHYLSDRDDSGIIIGLNHATYYAGITLAALVVPGLMRRLGDTCAPIGMFLSGATLLALPWGSGLPGWFGLRLISGVGAAMSLVPLETMVSLDSSSEGRTRNFSFYGVALTLGGALGLWAGPHFYAPGDALPFLCGGIVPIIGGLALLGLLRRKPSMEPAAPPRYAVDWTHDYLCYATAWFQGFLEGGMLAFLELYLIALGMNKEDVGGLMGVTVIGVLAFQVPVVWLAGRFGRLSVLLGCYGVVAAGLIMVPQISEVVPAAVCLFLLGASAGALYPLGLAMLGDRLTERSMARAYALFMAVECAGSPVGAAAMGAARDYWGGAAMFGVGLAALVLVIGSWIALVVVRRRRLNTSS